MTEFRVSVVIPVYNTKQYLNECIQSVILLEEVKEVIIIDDGSTDGSLELSQELANNHKKVIVHQHEGGVNKGRGESRNLGIRVASQRYISFLDSDDVFLTCRYNITKDIFTKNPNIDGVYEAIGILFESDHQQSEWERRFKFKLTTVNNDLSGPALFRSILWGTNGHFSGNGLTIKKEAISKSGDYPNLAIAEDTHLFLRMALTCNLKAGNITSETGLRRVHGDNSVLQHRKSISRQHITMYKDLIKWSSINKIRITARIDIYLRLLLQYLKHMKY